MPLSSYAGGRLQAAQLLLISALLRPLPLHFANALHCLRSPQQGRAGADQPGAGEQGWRTAAVVERGHPHRPHHRLGLPGAHPDGRRRGGGGRSANEHRERAPLGCLLCRAWNSLCAPVAVVEVSGDTCALGCTCHTGRVNRCVPVSFATYAALLYGRCIAAHQGRYVLCGKSSNNLSLSCCARVCQTPQLQHAPFNHVQSFIAKPAP